MAQHRYWRILATALSVPEAIPCIIKNIELRESVGGADATYDATLSVVQSRVNESSYFTDASSFGFPGADTRGWRAFADERGGEPYFWAASADYPQWVRYAWPVGSTKDVKEIAMQAPVDVGWPWSYYAPGAFSLQYSDDDATWNTIQSWTGLTWTSGEIKLFEVTNVEWTNIQYARLGGQWALALPTTDTRGRLAQQWALVPPTIVRTYLYERWALVAPTVAGAYLDGLWAILPVAVSATARWGQQWALDPYLTRLARQALLWVLDAPASPRARLGGQWFLDATAVWTPVITRRVYHMALQSDTELAVEIPISSFQARLRGADSYDYLSCVIPAYPLYLDAIEARIAAGEFIISMGEQWTDGTYIVTEIARADLDSVSFDAGAESVSATLIGTKATVAGTPKTVTLTGLSYRDATGGRLRVRAEANRLLRPGDTAVADPDTFIVGEIVWMVNARMQTFEVAEVDA